MLNISQVRVRVDDAERAAAFYSAVFGWDLRLARSDTGRSALGARLVLTDDSGEPDVRLGFTVPDPSEAAKQVEGLGGQIEHAAGTAVRCRDDQGTPLLLRVADIEDSGQASPRGRGVLGVIFVFARDLDRAAEFYGAFAGWAFEAIGSDKDILFVTNGPPVGIRAASKAPGGRSGAVTFHVSVSEPESVIEAIEGHGGRVGPAQSAGVYTTRACHDDQGTAFSLWYQPTGT